MQGSTHEVNVAQSSTAGLNSAYVCGMATVAAMEGLLFGYDWVVIGGAKPFYEVYFHLNSENLIGWANSCALLGCLIGALVAGEASSRLGAGFAYHAGWRGSSVLVLTLAAIACYSMSLAPVTWVLISEIYPNRLRSLGVSAAVAALWIACFVLTYTFTFINRIFTTTGVFLVYEGICFLGFFFVFVCVPETRGKTLEEIERASGADAS
jgi:MFS family permease